LEDAELKEWLLHLGTWFSIFVTNKIVLLALGGAVGTNLRYWLSRWFNEVSWSRGFPLGTFVINVTGSFILGLAAVIILERLTPAYQNWYLLFGTGFCGGYTTFSTFEWETFKLVRDGSWWMATLNVVGSVMAGFIGVLIAVTLMGMLFPKR
jgi:fluoride exporter